jgi:ferredoxin
MQLVRVPADLFGGVVYCVDEPSPLNYILYNFVSLYAKHMTYVVTEACLKCKYTDCVEVCPVDCFYEGEAMLVIHPEQCIDCAVCVPACPANAILPDTDPAAAPWLDLNRRYSECWPNIRVQKAPLVDADAFKGVPDKMRRFFSPNPGTGT